MPIHWTSQHFIFLFVNFYVMLPALEGENVHVASPHDVRVVRRLLGVLRAERVQALQPQRLLRREATSLVYFVRTSAVRCNSLISE